jgi:hypothetical protein
MLYNPPAFRVEDGVVTLSQIEWCLPTISNFDMSVLLTR